MFVMLFGLLLQSADIIAKHVPKTSGPVTCGFATDILSQFRIADRKRT